MNEKQRNMLAQGLVISKLTFCICYWGGTPWTNLEQIQIQMNEAARTVAGADRMTELNTLYKRIDWLNLKSLVYYHDMVQLTSIMRNYTPKDLWHIIETSKRNLRERTERVHRLQTADRIPYDDTTSPTFKPLLDSFIPRAVKFYNNFLDYTGMRHEEERIKAFKLHIKQNLVQVQFTGIDIYDLKEFKDKGRGARAMTNVKGKKARQEPPRCLRHKVGRNNRNRNRNRNNRRN